MKEWNFYLLFNLCRYRLRPRMQFILFEMVKVLVAIHLLINFYFLAKLLQCSKNKPFISEFTYFKQYYGYYIIPQIFKIMHEDSILSGSFYRQDYFRWNLLMPDVLHLYRHLRVRKILDRNHLKVEAASVSDLAAS